MCIEVEESGVDGERGILVMWPVALLLLGDSVWSRPNWLLARSAAELGQSSERRSVAGMVVAMTIGSATAVMGDRSLGLGWLPHCVLLVRSISM